MTESCHRFPEKEKDGREEEEEEEEYGRKESRHSKHTIRERRESKWKFIEYKAGKIMLSNHAR